MKIIYLGVFSPHCSDKYRVKGFEEAGYEVHALDFRACTRENGLKNTWKTVLNWLDTFHPDIVFVNKGEVFKPIHIKTLKLRCRLNGDKPKWLMFYGDHLLSLPTFLKKNAKSFDGILVETDDPEFCDPLLKAGARNVFYHHSATDLSVFRKLPQVKETSDVAFFGNNYNTFPLSKKRREIIAALIHSDFKLKIYGASSWWGYSNGLRWGDDFARAASESKIIVGISTTSGMNKFASNRIWNSMACGMHLTYWFKGIDEIFENHKHLVWFESVAEMLDLVNYYTRNDEKRLEIYKNGLEFIKNGHTYYHRALELKTIYESLS